MLGNLIGGFIVIVIGTSLLPVVANSVATALYINGSAALGNNANITGAASTVVGLVTLFYALGLMSSGVAIAVSGLRQAGIM